MGLLSEGQQIRGTYEVERFLGEGAFAEVYRVRHRFLGRQAMKVFKLIGITIEETESMLGEAILLSRFGHPNIVRVFDANVTETSKGTCGFFTMEYVAGGSLEQFWRSHGSKFVPVEAAVDIIRQACAGIAAAHGEKPPIIHRDIKPQNLLVGYEAEGLRVRVSDFGLAKQVNPLTLLASARGTRSFKAPEALMDPKSDSCACDVWALGCTLYLLLTDRLPFEGVAQEGGLDEIFSRPLIPPSRLNARVDAVLDQVVGKSLAVDPRARFPSAQAFLNDLLKWEPRAPARSGQLKLEGTSMESKSALGRPSSADETWAQRTAKQSLHLAKQVSQLGEAADLMEEAFNKWPPLRDLYADRVQLWRRGILM